MNDFRFAFRQLLKNPGFTAVAVLTLALGIGANTAVFSVLNELLFKPLPVRDPDSLDALVLVDARGERTDQSISFPIYRDYAELNHAFSDLIAFAPLAVTRVQTPEGRVPVQAQIVSGNFFSALGVQPVLGRVFSEEEDKVPLRDAVALISHEYWTKRLNADPQVIGQTLQFHDPIAGPKDFAIIGVAPSNFRGIGQGAPAIWLPAAMHAHFKKSQLLNFHLVGRRAPGITEAQATARLNLVTDQIAKKYGGAKIPGYEADPPFQAGLRALLKPAGRGLWGPFQDQRDIWLASRLSFGTVLLMLLVGCGNVANLLLARAAVRQREIAVRLSLGASRARLVWQMLTESLVLAALACVGGLILAQWSNALLMAIRPSNVLLVATHLDGRVISFAGSLSVFTAILFGLAPALQSTNQDLNSALKDDSRTAAGTDRKMRLRNALLIGQMAFSLVLLIGAGLCLRSFNRLQSVDPGFDCDHLITASLDADGANLTERSGPAFYRELMDRLAAIPGVRSVSFADSTPFATMGWMSGPPVDQIEGYLPHPGEAVETKVHIVGPNYFRTLGVPQTRGLVPPAQERRERILVNESFVRRFWPETDPVGKWLGRWRVDGVVRDCRMRQLWQPAEPEIFWQREQPLGSRLNLLVRVQDGPAAVLAAIRSELAAGNRSLRLSNLEPMPQLVERSLGAQRFAAVLMGNAALAALFLGAVGLYGVMSFMVSQRTREIGIRMALGARGIQVLVLIVRQGMTLVLAGAALGTLAALALSRALANRLYEITPTDPLTFALVTLVLAAAALAACWFPARRAARVDPMEALRCE